MDSAVVISYVFVVLAGILYPIAQYLDSRKRIRPCVLSMWLSFSVLCSSFVWAAFALLIGMMYALQNSNSGAEVSTTDVVSLAAGTVVASALLCCALLLYAAMTRYFIAISQGMALLPALNGAAPQTQQSGTS